MLSDLKNWWAKTNSLYAGWVQKNEKALGKNRMLEKVNSF